MKRKLIKHVAELYHYVNDKKILGPNPRMSGDCSGLKGNIDDCDLSDQERLDGIDICELVGKGELK